MTNRSKGSIAAGIALAVVLVAAGVWFLFFRSDAPPKVDLESATEQVTSTTTGDGDGDGDGATTTSEAPTPADIEGTWVVDDESGEFDFESATGSFAGYRVQEELASIGSTEAVGRTGEVTGEMAIAGTTMESVQVTVDLSAIESDKPRRDNRVQDALETEEFPTADFELTEPVELGPDAAASEEISVEATGELTIHGVTREVTVELAAQLVDGTAVVVGSIPIELSDFGVEAPSAPMVLSVSEEATIEFQLLFTPSDAPLEQEASGGEPATTGSTAAP
ncbi:MAG: YceI family protein [Microthrixaceae bacterium]|nr:YceI family protein [Microthrixaceae bacterium]